MKKEIKTKITAVLCSALLILSGCKDESYPTLPTFKEDEGGFSMKELNINVNTSITPIESRAGEDMPDVSEYMVKIVFAETGQPVSSQTQWLYKNMPEMVTLPVGKYRVEVESCDWSDKFAEWELPHYIGSCPFEVKAGEITKADKVPCVLNNIKVTVRFTDALKKILNEEAKVTVVASQFQDGAGKPVQLEFAKNETRAGYFKAVENSRTMIATLSYRYNNVDNTIYHTMNDIKAGQHRLITYDYKASDPDIEPETGTLSRGEIKVDVKIIEVDINGTVSIKEQILDISDRPGQEDPTPGPGPDDPTPPVKDDIDIPNPGLDYFDLTKVNEVSPDDSKDRRYVLTIESKKGFNHLNVEINSETLTGEILSGVGLAAAFDLATGLAADGKDLTEGLKSLNFPVGAEVTGDGVTSVDFNITDFVPLLCLYDPANHTFVLTITDKDGKTKKVELKFHSN